MERTDVLIDTGPLVGLLSERDQHHAWAKRQVARLEWPFYTCEAMLSETIHLLEHSSADQLGVVDMLERGLIEVAFSYAEHAGRVHDLLRTYADQPMSFADACLVRLTEIRPKSRVFTTDDDFHVYRKEGGAPIDVLTPGR